MTVPRESNTSAPSTTWAWRRVKISPAPQADKPQRAVRRTAAGLARRDPRKPLQVTVVYRGGAECWWEIRARGVVLRRPGSIALHDVLSALEGEGPA